MELLIAATSDLHGELPDVPEVDILLLAGDIAPGGVEDKDKQVAWINGVFREWLSNSPAKLIIATPGNHDIALVNKQYNLPWIYLQDEGIQLDGISIYGMPWVTPFYGVLNADEKEMAQRLAVIPENTDIVLAHGPPYGVNDLVDERRTGSKAFRKNIQDSNYGLVVHGHIHECFGRRRLRNKHNKDTLIANVSYDNFTPQPNPLQMFTFETATGVFTGLPWMKRSMV